MLGRGYRLIGDQPGCCQGRSCDHDARAHGDVLYHPLDVADRGSVASLRAYVERVAGRLDTLVNNAGVYLEGSQGILAVADDAFLATLSTNTFGPLWLCRAFLPMMLEQGYGRVVNVSSGMGQMSDLNDYGAAYRVSKLALNGITRILADAAPRQQRVGQRGLPGVGAHRYGRAGRVAQPGARRLRHRLGRHAARRWPQRRLLPGWPADPLVRAPRVNPRAGGYQDSEDR